MLLDIDMDDDNKKTKKFGECCQILTWMMTTKRQKSLVNAARY